jgi:shikimate kinase
MAGCGKSTLGQILSEKFGLCFIDSDELMEKHLGLSLFDGSRYLSERDFLDLEEKVILNLAEAPQVISTGGSVVYSNAAMMHLKNLGVIIYLKVSPDELLSRIPNLETRGIVGLKEATDFRKIHAERENIYERWADVTVETTHLTLKETLNALTEKLGEQFLM